MSTGVGRAGGPPHCSLTLRAPVLLTHTQASLYIFFLGKCNLPRECLGKAKCPPNKIKKEDRKEK